MIGTIGQILELIKNIRIQSMTRTVAIDGNGGSGKRRLAAEMTWKNPSMTIVPFDFFYTPGLHSKGDTSLPDFNWQRLEREVLKPVRQNRNTRYRQYDWIAGKPGKWVELKAGRILIIEGVTSMKQELLHNYDYKIWVDCPLDIRLTRAREREGEESVDTWLKRWIPAEDNYFELEAPNLKANLIFDSSGLDEDLSEGRLYQRENPKNQLLESRLFNLY